MAPYVEIFEIALALNVFMTFRASSWWKKYKCCKSGSSESGEDRQALMGGGSVNEAVDQRAKEKHAHLLRRYLCVYLLATLSDWLQGPYVYALYDAYGYSQHWIAVLFVAGFGSSMVFGSFIGGLADSCGRRRFVLLFSAVYGASCLTKHFPDFWILMLGRLLGGVATSLLFSVFDAWLIRSHADAGIDKSFLSSSFSSAAYGNSIIAIVAGLLANRAASSGQLRAWGIGAAHAVPPEEAAHNAPMGQAYVGGFLNPFDIALVALVLCGSLAAVLWEENYGTDADDHDGAAGDNHNNNNNKNDNDDGEGDSGSASKETVILSSSSSSSTDDQHTNGNRKTVRWFDPLKNAFTTTMRDSKILLCGVISSLFEGSMYVFVFMWTPALKSLAGMDDSGGHRRLGDNDNDSKSDDSGPSLPFGLIFSTFMVCCMLGSSIFSVAMEYHIPCDKLGIYVFLVAGAAFCTVTASSDETLTFVGMNVFEVCVGMYFPIMGTLKGTIVPEDKRAAIYNLYRIPLNFIVLFSLLTDLTPTTSFLLCSIMMMVATVLQHQLLSRRKRDAAVSSKSGGDEDDHNKNAGESTSAGGDVEEG